MTTITMAELKAEGNIYKPVFEIPISRANATGISPTEFKVLILPDPVEETTKGGIIVPIAKAESDKYATIEGRIIAVSHLAFNYATAKEWGDAKPKPGDRVIFAKYAGVRHKAKDGQEYLLVNDKDIVATIED